MSTCLEDSSPWAQFPLQRRKGGRKGGREKERERGKKGGRDGREREEWKKGRGEIERYKEKERDFYNTVKLIRHSFF